MATMLDAVNNPLGPLGITSFTGSPAKEKTAVPGQAAFPSIEKPADPRPEIERRRGEIGNEFYNIDVQIIDNLAQQGRFQAAQAKQNAESEAKYLRELDTSKKALEKSLYESPAYKTIQEKSQELAEKSTFNPDQQNAQTLAAVFSIIGAAGFLLGGNNKNTAKSALAAMNGMAEGYAKGRDQYAKEQRAVFETNQKALRGTLDSLEKAFTYELEQNKNDLESATRNAKIAALQRDASFINDNIDKYGLVSTLEQLRSNKKRLETVISALQKKEDAYSAEMQKEWFANETKKAISAASQDKVIYQEEERKRRQEERREDQERRDRERREDKLSDIARSENFRREMARFRVENRAERGQAAGKPPPANVQQAVQLRNTLIPDLEKALPVLERIQKQGDWPRFTALIGVEPRAAEFSFRNDPEAQKAIRTLSRFRSAEFETAGKALTKVENKILAPLYQAGFRDYNALKGAIEDGLEVMSTQKLAYERQYPQLATEAVPQPVAQPAPQVVPGKLTPEEQKELDELRKRFPKGASK
jgi:hypothetical protein